MSQARWISEGAEVLVRQLADDAASGPPPAFHCDVLIVGSGYGGAVAAARLAGAQPNDGGGPIKVYVLERGQEYLPGMFPASFAEIPGHVRFSVQGGSAPRGKREGLFDFRIGRDVSVLVGNGLGGGSLINAAVMERATADAFTEGWPAGIDLESLGEGYERAEAMLSPRELPGTVAKFGCLARAAEVTGAVANKVRLAVAFESPEGGVPSTPAGVTRSNCTKCGDCVSGCNHGAKYSLDVNYLAVAMAAGARLFCGATVYSVQRTSRGGRAGYAVQFGLTDHTKATEMTALFARRVILAAGAMGSTEILLRSRGKGLDTPNVLGLRFSANGDMIFAARGQHHVAHVCDREGTAPALRQVGPTITGMFRKPVDGRRPIVIQEFGIPAPLRRVLAEVVTNTDAVLGTLRKREDDQPEAAQDPLALDDVVLDRTMVYGAMGDDGAHGSLVLPFEASPSTTDGRVVVKWKDAGRAAVYQAQFEALESAHESTAIGGSLLPNPAWLVGQLTGTNGGVFTVHPLGGCAMGDDDATSVVNDFGLLHGHEGLVVLDGSIIPVSLGINPALTIASLAERAVPLLMTKWALEPSVPATPANPSSQPVRRSVTQPAATRPTSIELRERLTGELRIADSTYPAAAVVTFAPIDVEQVWVSRSIALPHVSLELTQADGSCVVVALQGVADVLVDAPSELDAQDVRTRIRELVTSSRLGDGLDLSKPDPKRRMGWRRRLWLLRTVRNLSKHLAESRVIRYRCFVTQAPALAPLKAGDEIRLTKQLANVEGGNPWRQLTEGELELQLPDGSFEPVGRLRLDPGFLADQLVPLVSIKSQQDAPNALADLAHLALWILRVVMRTGMLSLWPTQEATQQQRRIRFPETVGTVDPSIYNIGVAGDQLPTPLRLSRYQALSPAAGRRPVMLIHGYGASGSTFAHPAIGQPEDASPDAAPDPAAARNLVRALLDAHLDVWVLDLRTSIGFEQSEAWTFEEVATSDIARAVEDVVRLSAPPDGKVDVVAHCIGAAMLCTAMLQSPTLHTKIGTVVLSQVGPLMRMSAFNRFRGFMASYLQQFIGVERFDTTPAEGGWGRAVDWLLNTFPYPDDDGEAERLAKVPGFAAVRHRADAIFGQTMQLDQVGDVMLRSLDSIYGPVMVKTLAQTIHFARESLVTDADGRNSSVTVQAIKTRMNVPLLIVHGRDNRVFDWRGSYDSIRLLTSVLDQSDKTKWLPEKPDRNLTVHGVGRRWLMVFDGYGHQDLLIGKKAHDDVFPSVARFLEAHAAAQQGPQPIQWSNCDFLMIEPPWVGPILGRVRAAGCGDTSGNVSLRIGLRPSPRHARTLGVILVPLAQGGGGALVRRLDLAVLSPVDADTDDLVASALNVVLDRQALNGFVGVAVLTLHDDLQTEPRWLTPPEVPGVAGLFVSPRRGLRPEVRAALAQALEPVDDEALQRYVVRLSPSWIDAAERACARPETLCFVVASCQYPPGLVDRAPAQAALARLAERLEDSSNAAKPQLLLLLGDQVYVDETAGMFEPAARDPVDRAYATNLRLPAMRRVLRQVPTFAMLDDHEVRDNWQPNALFLEDNRALEHYRRHWYKLMRGEEVSSPQPDAGPFDAELKPGGFPFFLFDTRSQRERRSITGAPDGSQRVEDAQIRSGGVDVLLTWLRAQDRNVPKFVATSVSVAPLPHVAWTGKAGERIALDDWGGYPASLAALLSGIRDEGIRNVVLLSGDRHMSSVSSVWIHKEGSDPIEVVSIVSSALYAPWPFANARPDELLLDGEWALGEGGAAVNGTIETHVRMETNGFAVVRVDRVKDVAASWRLGVELEGDSVTLRACVCLKPGGR